MKSLYVRIYLTIVAALLLFALVAGWLAQHHLEQERISLQAVANERALAWAALIERSLPPADAPEDEQRAALVDWVERLRLSLALDAADGHRVATSPRLVITLRRGKVTGAVSRLSSASFSSSLSSRRRRLRRKLSLSMICPFENLFGSVTIRSPPWFRHGNE